MAFFWTLQQRCEYLQHKDEDKPRQETEIGCVKKLVVRCLTCVFNNNTAQGALAMPAHLSVGGKFFWRKVWALNIVRFVLQGLKAFPAIPGSHDAYAYHSSAATMCQLPFMVLQLTIGIELWLRDHPDLLIVANLLFDIGYAAVRMISGTGVILSLTQLELISIASFALTMGLALKGIMGLVDIIKLRLRGKARRHGSEHDAVSSLLEQYPKMRLVSIAGCVAIFGGLVFGGIWIQGRTFSDSECIAKMKYDPARPELNPFTKSYTCYATSTNLMVDPPCNCLATATSTKAYQEGKRAPPLKL